MKLISSIATSFAVIVFASNIIGFPFFCFGSDDRELSTKIKFLGECEGDCTANNRRCAKPFKCANTSRPLLKKKGFKQRTAYCSLDVKGFACYDPKVVERSELCPDGVKMGGRKYFDSCNADVWGNYPGERSCTPFVNATTECCKRENMTTGKCITKTTCDLQHCDCMPWTDENSVWVCSFVNGYVCSDEDPCF